MGKLKIGREKTAFIVILAFFLTTCLIPSSSSDGAAFAKYQDAIELLAQGGQTAIVAYDKGYEKITVAININVKNAENVAWILPIPAEPENVTIEIADFPVLYGKDAVRQAREDIDYLMTGVSFTQIYPICYHILTFPVRMAGVEVHERLEKEGIVTELVTAENSNALYQYLQEKGFTLQAGALPVIDNYIGKGYSFSVSWISTSTNITFIDYPFRIPAVSAKFPVNKMYYPLLLTSAYGNRIIPIRIYVMAHVVPEVYDGIKQYTTTNYFLAPTYTKIEISAPSKNFTRDLWFNENAPSNVRYASTIHAIFSDSSLRFLMWTTLCLFLSVLVGAVVGWIVFHDLRKFAIIGLSNVGTIFSVAVVTHLFVKTKTVKKLWFLLSFSIVFVFLNFLVSAILKLPLT
jgi:hypothetical protein